MAHSTFIKICGITRVGDARTAARAGANAIGFVFARSPRRISPKSAALISDRVHPSVKKIGVFVNAALSEIREIAATVGLDGIQLHGNETADDIAALKRVVPRLWVAKVLRPKRDTLPFVPEDFPRADAVFIDTKDPSSPDRRGRRVPDVLLTKARFYRMVVAGGLNPANVGELVARHRPWGVDVSGGVESEPGKKDGRKVKAFIKAVRNAEIMPPDRETDSIGEKTQEQN